MAKRNPYVVMRTVRITTTAEPIYEGPMTYAEAMARKASLLARDKYYDEGASKLKERKNVYWLKNKANNHLIKVRIFNPEKENDLRGRIERCTLAFEAHRDLYQR